MLYRGPVLSVTVGWVVSDSGQCILDNISSILLKCLVAVEINNSTSPSGDRRAPRTSSLSPH